MKPATKKKLSYEERYAAARKAARDVGDARRSRNTSRHTLEEVRKVVNDAAIQLGQLGRRMDRDDLRALSAAIHIARQYVTKAPSNLVDIIRAFSEMESQALRYNFGAPGEPREQWGFNPHMSVPVTAEGLFQLHAAVTARVKAGKTPSLQDAALATPPLPPKVVAPPKGPPPTWLRGLLDDALASDGKDGGPCEG